MSIAEIRGVKITFNNGSIHIENSYQITDDEEKVKLLKCIFDLCPDIKEYRTLKNMFTEWKAHNILFQHKYKQERTKDVDFEYKQNKLHRIGFKLITMFMREKKWEKKQLLIYMVINGKFVL